VHRRAIVFLASQLAQPLSRDASERHQEDERPIDLILHLLRNLLYISDDTTHEELALLLYDEHVIQGMCIVLQQSIEQVRTQPIIE
jgi:hypothetical protein